MGGTQGAAADAGGSGDAAAAAVAAAADNSIPQLLHITPLFSRFFLHGVDS